MILLRDTEVFGMVILSLSVRLEVCNSLLLMEILFSFTHQH